ncbi:MAG: ribosome silencing factor [Candidatus Gastranaerophilales bacterium]|nr:ribosome silencing factor [Candidatus Gastranaerophilales bacterium]
MTDINSYKFACIIARMLDHRFGKDISILNISNVSVLSDYFVICSAETSTQVKAMTGYIREQIKGSYGRLPAGEESDQKNRWNLIDYGDVIIHILHKDERQFYAIEKFWNHAFVVEQSDWMRESEEISDKLS